jgi:vacuolar-type H+-ATPase subunit C/Vma6
MTASLRRAAREPSGIGRILDYLWQCSLEARNLGIIMRAGDLGPEGLAAEIVR